MKRLSLAFIFVCISLVLAAQEGIRVEYKGEKPTIADFAWALLSVPDDDEEGCIDESENAFKQAFENYRNGTPQEDGETLTVDLKNGFILYESRYEESLLRIEMCYWNEADKKHKLIAYNVACFFGDKYAQGQFDGLAFYRYDNATKEMTFCDDTGFEVEYGTEDGAMVSYSLPRTGKDITVSYWYENSKKEKVLKWGGRRFSL